MKLEIIAEIHPQHGGDMDVAREMIRRAREAGADVAKFQLYDALALLGPAWKYLELSREDVRGLKACCDEVGIEFMASVFDEERLGWCEELGVARHKIASPLVVRNRALCERILALGKPTIVSLGFWGAERDAGIGDAAAAELPFGTDRRISYLYCVSKYPALPDDLSDFPEDFQAMHLAGYSDHTVGIEAPLLAIARGARIVEKHMTLDKSRTRDTEKAHVCSMLPEELAELRSVGDRLFAARASIRDAAQRAAVARAEITPAGGGDADAALRDHPLRAGR